VELLIGVAYTSDMTIVKFLIRDTVEIDKNSIIPAPKVLMQPLGENSVDFRVLFWADDMDIWLNMRL
jgi:potassium efflux system protein